MVTKLTVQLRVNDSDPPPPLNEPVAETSQVGPTESALATAQSPKKAATNTAALLAAEWDVAARRKLKGYNNPTEAFDWDMHTTL